MTFIQFFTRKAPIVILLRCLLAFVVAALSIPLVVRYIAHEDLTAHSFYKYFFMAAFPASVLAALNLVSWWIDARTKKPEVYDHRPDV
ncbi:MAG: hypothetical protein WDM80_15785 [Limisphaerales bacterium]